MELALCPFQKQIDPTAQIIPDTPTAVTTYDTWLYDLAVANYTASDTTLTLTDGQASPVTLIPTVVVPANSTVSFEYFNGLFCKGGFVWTAGAATALSAMVVARRQADNGV